MFDDLPSLSAFVPAVAAALASYLALTVGLRFALGRARRLSGHTPNRLDDLLVEVLAGTRQTLLLLVAILIGVGLLDLPAGWNARVGQLWFAVLALQLALWGHRAITVGLRLYEQRHASAGAPQVSATTTLLSWALRTILWAVLLLAVLSNLGVNITAFVASLGVGGVAVALAVQNILGDLFASLSIAVDKPFEVGDAIAVGSVVGTVENVGLKTTRIRALGGEQVVMSNTDLLKQTISNYKRQQTRRVAFTFGIAPGARADQLAEIPAAVRRVVQARPRLDFQRAHFKSIGTASHDFEVVYLVKDSSYDVYMDEQQAINLALLRELQSRGVALAFPARMLAPLAAAA